MAKDPSEKAPEGDAPAQGKSSDKKLFIVIAAAFLILAVAYGISLGPIEVPEATEDAAEESATEESATEEGAEAEAGETDLTEAEQVYGEDVQAEDALEDGADVASAPTLFDLNKAKKERVWGDSSAPIKITEHSSLTCGHCGKFHREVFGQFKTDYIDTGKAYVVFSDFPLNAPALHATMAARCIADDESYFKFIQELFENQALWAGESNYAGYLKKAAAQYGLDENAFNACVQNKDLQETLLKRIQAVQKQWEINSTPSFVINNQEVLSGSRSYEAFVKDVEDAVAKIEAQKPSEPAQEGE
ncbi:MAG: DsbA family protein [Rhodospirillales bacterium]|nr:DsbA family protein [Rhodospirillales bacterium]